MYIFQPDRFLLRNQVSSASRFLSGKILDVGAGETDRYGEYFPGSEIIRMDVREGANIDIVGSADNIPFPDIFFDSILCTQVFEHLPNPQKSASELFRVLKHGGYAIVTAPQMNELHDEPHDYFRYTKYGLERLFSDAGFTIVECLQRGGFYSTIAQMRIRYLFDRYRLHQRPLLGIIMAKFIAVYGRIMLWRDDGEKNSIANRRHAIGWCVVLKKN